MLSHAPVKPPEISVSNKSLVPCIFDDHDSELDLLCATVAEMGYSSRPTSNPEEVCRLVQSGECRVVFAAVELCGGASDFALLNRIVSLDPGAFVIVMSANHRTESALEAVRLGAADFLSKPIDPLRLRDVLRDAEALFDQRRRVQALQSELLNDWEFLGLVGKSPAMLEVCDFVRKVARHYRYALLAGPPGSGKESVARAMQRLSPAGRERMVICPCPPASDTQLEIQLFGCARGAAGSADPRPGIFEYADRGTVFLEEIAETSLAVQARLVRLLQTREVQRLGSNDVRLVNVRLIAATCRDLRAESLAGRFREDLLQFLGEVQRRIPPLAARVEDIPLLVSHFVKKYNAVYAKSVLGVSRRAQDLLLRHPWPGNVRELEQVISSALVTTAKSHIDLEDLPETMHRPLATPALESLSLDEVCNAHIRRVLALCRGNRLRAAQILGIGRTSLYRYLKQDPRAAAPSRRNKPEPHPATRPV